MSMEKMKIARSVVFDFETILIIDKVMEERTLNFSQACSFLIKQGDYLLKKIQLARQEQKLKEGNTQV